MSRVKAVWDNPTLMFTIIGAWFLATVVVVLATSCGSAPPGPLGTQLGNPAVHQELLESTDCTALQAAFDRADQSRKRALAEDPADTVQADISLSYMGTADDRMVELQCTPQPEEGTS